MTHPAFRAIVALSAVFACHVAGAQTGMHDTTASMKHEAGIPSTLLTVTGLDGSAKKISLADVMAMAQTTVTVTNGHSHKQETYAGVQVSALLALVAPAKIVPVAGEPTKPRISPRMTVIVARGTDNFRVAITLCDTDPACRSGEAIVADSMDGKPLTTDGAFKLILTEDKAPGRWVRNLDALTVKNLGAMAATE